MQKTKEAVKAKQPQPPPRDLVADRRVFQAGLDTFLAGRRRQRKEHLSEISSRVKSATNRAASAAEKTNA